LKRLPAAKGVLVGDIMTTEVITITPDTHLLLIIDIMIKKHVRRLPVVEDGKIVGIVYLSRVFNQLLEKLAG
jgi:CBS domain-containing protein